MDRYKFLYELSRKALDEELERYKKLDEKASRFLSILSVVIVAYTALISKAFPTMAMPGWRGWLFYTLTVMTLLALFSSWLRIFSSIRLSESPRVVIGETVNALAENEELITMYNSMALSCQDALTAARQILNGKTRCLQSAYKEIQFSTYCLLASLLTYFLLTLTDIGNPPMTDQKKPAEKPAEQQKPNPAAPRAPVEMVLDHVDPLKKR